MNDRNAEEHPQDDESQPLRGDRPSQIRARHLATIAIVYVRQSSPEQVRKNIGSTEAQIDLAELPRRWGWPDPRILIITEDLGRSGELADTRTGFQQMLDRIDRREVGLIIVREASRLARNPLDSERFLTKAIDAGVLICVGGRVFDTATEDLAELLGLRIQNLLAWFENRQRVRNLLAAKVAKVRQGYAVSRPPTGYVASVKGKWIKNADLNVQIAFRRVIDLSLQFLSGGKVVKYFREHNLQFPVHAGGRLIWKPLTRSTVDRILRNPHYAGFYVLRRHPRPGQEAEEIVDKHHHEPYMTEAEWIRLGAARAARRPAERPPIGQGRALLQGLLRCSEHDRWMRTKYDRYEGRLRVPSYQCRHADAIGDVRIHRSIRARYLDHAVVDHVVAALTPPALEAGLAAINLAQAEHGDLLNSHRRLLRHAEDEVATARRRYEEVDGSHSLVKADLEAQLEEALRRRDERRRALTEACHATSPAISDEDAAQIVTLAQELPRLWNASTTSDEDRKRLLQTVVSKAIMHAVTDEAVELEIVWAGGFRETVHALRPAGIDQLVARIRETGKTAPQIARELQEAGVRNVRGYPITPGNVYNSLHSRLRLRRRDDLDLAWRRIQTLIEGGRSRTEIQAILPTEFPRLGQWARPRLHYAITKIRQRVPDLPLLPKRRRGPIP